MPEWSPRSPNRGCVWIAIIALATTVAGVTEVVSRLV